MAEPTTSRTEADPMHWRRLSRLADAGTSPTPNTPPHADASEAQGCRSCGAELNREERARATGGDTASTMFARGRDARPGAETRRVSAAASAAHRTSPYKPRRVGE